MNRQGVLRWKVVAILVIFGVTSAGVILDSSQNVVAARTATVGGEIVYSSYYSYKAYGVRTVDVGSPGSALPLPLHNSNLASISADGKQVAVASAGSVGPPGSPPGALQVSSLNGSHKRTIWKYMGTPMAAPAWNPAGTEIAITVMPQRGRGGELYPGAVRSGLWVVPVNGGRPHLIAPNAYSNSTPDLAWSSTGASLVYTTNHGAIRTISPKGGRYHQLAVITPYSRFAIVYISVAWSPTSNSILIDSYQQLSTGNPIGHSEIQQVASSGGDLKTILPINPSAYYAGAVYSPDGKRVAVITVTAPPPGTTTTLPYVQDYPWTLNTLSINGSDVQTIARLSPFAEMIGWLKKLN